MQKSGIGWKLKCNGITANICLAISGVTCVRVGTASAQASLGSYTNVVKVLESNNRTRLHVC